MENEQPERRRFRRLAFSTRARLSQDNVQRYVAVADISLKGVLLEVFDSGGLDLQRPLQLVIPLAENVAISMEVQHIHHASDSIGLQCSSIDLDSMAHLRRLIEYNLGDPEASERELAQLFEDRNQDSP